tara:strand:- start:193 stop:363 length:171 start_codon:yes stop_codon:yes gene_type:complete
MMTFKLSFVDEAGHFSHDETITGEGQSIFAYLQGYLSASNYHLAKIESLGVLKVDN